VRSESSKLDRVRDFVKRHDGKPLTPQLIDEGINTGRDRRERVATQPTPFDGELTMPLLLDPPIYESASDAKLREWLDSLREMRAEIPETDRRAHESLDRSERETRAELDVRVREAAES
jgi:hypothetical protein